MSTPAIAQSLWIPMVEQNLFDPLLEKIRGALRDDSAFANGDTVVIPNAGAATQITVNRDSYPAAIAKRKDEPVSYNIKNIEADPILLQWAENQEINYNKAESILLDAIDGLGQRAGLEILRGLYASDTDYSITTTGSAVAAHAPGATGNRKSLSAYDLMKAAEVMDRNNIKGERFAFLDTVSYHQVLKELGFTANRLSEIESLNLNLPTIYSFNLIQIASPIPVQSNKTLRDVGSAGGTTDQVMNLCVSRPHTSYVIDGIYAPVTEDAASFGWIYSAAIRAGSKYRRTDKKGIVPIIQANA